MNPTSRQIAEIQAACCVAREVLGFVHADVRAVCRAAIEAADGWARNPDPDQYDAIDAATQEQYNRACRMTVPLEGESLAAHRYAVEAAMLALCAPVPALKRAIAALEVDADAQRVTRGSADPVGTQRGRP